MFFFFGLPRVIQAVIKRIVRLSGNERRAMVMDWVHEYTRDEIDEALRAKQRIVRDINHRWQVERLDACISPAYYHAAFKHEDDADMGLIADYTAIWNTLHFPAGVVPVTEVLPEEEKVYTDNYNDMITSKCRSNV